MGHPRYIDGDALPAADWGGVMDAIELQSVMILGRGVVGGGLALSAGGGFDLDISSGYVNLLKLTSITGFTYEVPPSVTRFVWIDEAGAITLTATSAYPGGQKVCLGQFTSDGSGITSVSTNGRMVAWDWSDERTLEFGLTTFVIDNLNNRVGIGVVPTDLFESAHPLTAPGLDAVEGAEPAPVAGRVRIYAADPGSGFAELHVVHEDAGAIQITEGGLVKATALALDKQREHPYNSETLSANKTLAATDANIQVLDPNGANRDVFLPANADVTPGMWFKIVNPAAANNLVVKSNLGTTTIVTLTPKQYALIEAIPSGATDGWPDTATALAVEDVAID